MYFASRPSLTGLSHRLEPPVPAGAPESAITARFAVLGGFLGVVLSGLSLLPVVGSEAQHKATVMLSVTLSSALAATFFAGIGASTWGLLVLIGSRARGAQLAQRTVTILGAALSAIYVLLRGAGEAFRLSSGETLGLGSCEFVVEGFEQLARPLLSEYSTWFALLAVACLLAAGLSFWLLNLPLRRPLSPWKLGARGLVSMATCGVLVVALSSPRGQRADTLAATADLSLLASWAQRRDDDATASSNHGEFHLVRRGPLRQVQNVYDMAVHHEGRDSAEAPNVLIIMLESVGIGHLGFMGYPRGATPRIDQLAAESLKFTQARTTATHSNYAQMAVLSSLFPRRYSGLDTYRRLDYPRTLWNDVLTPLGHRTATISSQDEGWQGMIRFESTNDHHPIHHSGNYQGPTQMMGSERTVPDDETARRAVRWISEQKGPFGLYLNFQSTHFPYVVPGHFKKKYLPDRPTRGKFHYLGYPKSDRARVINRYDNALSFVDAQIGVIVDALERMGALDSTIIVITSDHGEMFGQHEMVTHGRTLFDAEARVPFLLRYPGRVRPGADRRPVSTLDVLPTLSGLLGIPVHPGFQGVDLLGESYDADRPVFLNIQGMRSREGVVCNGYKYTRGPSGNKPALFDLVEDPGEMRNLVDIEPSRADMLDQFLAAHMRAQMAYYRPSDNSLRATRFPPRFGRCPKHEPNSIGPADLPEPSAVDLERSESLHAGARTEANLRLN